MNKRGFLLGEETLKILIAVICIIFLAFFLVSLYNSKTGADKIRMAEENLKRIGEIVSSVQEGVTQTQDIPNPEGWHLYSFIGDEKPNSCLSEDCICICSSSTFEFITTQQKKCDDKGSCLVVPNLASADLDIKINGPDDLTVLGIKRQDGKILIGVLK